MKNAGVCPQLYNSLLAVILFLTVPASADDRAAAGSPSPTAALQTALSLNPLEIIRQHIDAVPGCAQGTGQLLVDTVKSVVTVPMGMAQILKQSQAESDRDLPFYNSCVKIEKCKRDLYTSAYQEANGKKPPEEVFARLQNGRDLQTVLRAIENRRRINNMPRIREILDNMPEGPKKEAALEEASPGWKDYHNRQTEALSQVVMAKLGEAANHLKNMNSREAGALVCTQLATIFFPEGRIAKEVSAGAKVGAVAAKGITRRQVALDHALEQATSLEGSNKSLSEKYFHSASQIEENCITSKSKLFECDDAITNYEKLFKQDNPGQSLPWENSIASAQPPPSRAPASPTTPVAKTAHVYTNPYGERIEAKTLSRADQSLLDRKLQEAEEESMGRQKDRKFDRAKYDKYLETNSLDNALKELKITRPIFEVAGGGKVSIYDAAIPNRRLNIDPAGHYLTIDVKENGAWVHIDKNGKTMGDYRRENPTFTKEQVKEVFAYHSHWLLP